MGLIQLNGTWALGFGSLMAEHRVSPIMIDCDRNFSVGHDLFDVSATAMSVIVGEGFA
jgi:hypothetical protein